MPIRFTPAGMAYTSLRADTSAHLRADFDVAAQAAGWVVVRSLTNGKMYELTSPQSLKCRCRVQDAGNSIGFGPHFVDVQFCSVDETLLGFLSGFMFGTTWISANGYTIHINQCSLFAKVLGQVHEQHDGTFSYALAGGIPAYPDNVDASCSSQETEVITELWWSHVTCGSAINNVAGLRNGRFCFVGYSTCKNAAIFTMGGNMASPSSEDAYAGPLQLLCETVTNNVDSISQIPIRTRRYGNVLLNLDAILLFRHAIFGQVYDAFCKSGPTTLDEEITTTESDGVTEATVTWEGYNYWVNFDNTSGQGTWFNTLYLLKGVPGQIVIPGQPDPPVESNYAY